ncbi:MAG: zinc ribbon domain-containing protein [Betaproteobacteria bacterium]|nr:zinc ribbon domain-containing protein [Betaproteobacteria bacterium]
MAKRNCPYCAHSNATDAKFCVACGAVMHLAPCPHCGSINHINVEKCYRCGGDLPKQEILEGEPEAAPGIASPASESSAREAGEAPPADTSPTFLSHGPPTVLVRAEPESQAGRPSLAVMFIIICSFVFAGLYAYKHRGGVQKDDAAKGPATAAPPTQAAPATTPPTVPVAQPAPAEPAKPPAETAKAPPAVAAKPAAKPAGKPAPADAPPKPAAPVTPCTEAVAALGLCKPDAK